MKTIVSLTFFICLLSCNQNNEKFKLCSGKVYPYYYPALDYQGGFYEIKKHFYNNYKKTTGLNNTGIVKVRFNINCRGVAGNYSFETYNFNYEKISLDREIVEQIFSLTKALDGWISAADDDGKSVNSHKFLAFKIKEGNLIDILPK